MHVYAKLLHIIRAKFSHIYAYHLCKIIEYCVFVRNYRILNACLCEIIAHYSVQSSRMLNHVCLQNYCNYSRILNTYLCDIKFISENIFYIIYVLKK